MDQQSRADGPRRNPNQGIQETKVVPQEACAMSESSLPLESGHHNHLVLDSHRVRPNICYNPNMRCHPNACHHPEDDWAGKSESENDIPSSPNLLPGSEHEKSWENQCDSDAAGLAHVSMNHRRESQRFYSAMKRSFSETDLIHKQLELQYASRGSSQRTTSLESRADDLDDNGKLGPEMSRFEKLLQRELELEELNSPGSDYATAFDQFVKDSVPKPGKVKKNDVGRRNQVHNDGEKVDLFSDDEATARRNIVPITQSLLRGRKRGRNTSFNASHNTVPNRVPTLKRAATDVGPSRTSDCYLSGGSSQLHGERRSRRQREQRHVAKKPKPSPKPSPKPASRRSSRQNGSTMKPESRQFLRGVVFFWLPNDEKLLGRSIRMTRAQEWGAKRAMEFSSEVTHLVIEESWTYEYALKKLELTSLPEHIAVVNEKYPPGCIELGYIADPLSGRFRVRGHQEALDRIQAARQTLSTAVSIEMRPQFHEEESLSAAAEQSLVQSFVTAEFQLSDEECSKDCQSKPESEDYAVSDSQPDNIPSAPTSPAPREVDAYSKVRLNASLNIESAKKEAPSTPQADNEPYRMKVFELARKVPREPYVPPWDQAPHKTPRTPPPKDDGTPLVTPVPTTGSISTISPGMPRPKDALDAAITEVKVFLDEDSNDPDELEGETDDDLPPVNSSGMQSLERSEGWQWKFRCMHRNEAGLMGANAATVEMLQEMADFYYRTNDEWRSIAYRKAISALKGEKAYISTKAQAVKIQGIGPKMADKIEEIASTGNLRKLELARRDPEDAILQAFMQVYGVGCHQAHKWISLGFKTLSDIKKCAELTDAQRIGLEHYDDFLQRIPRQEVSSHGSLVNQTLTEVSWKLKMLIGGSYRRGVESCGDIDFLITSSDINMPSHVLCAMVHNELIPRLQEKGYIQALLTSPFASSSKQSPILHGAATLPNYEHTIWRRVDFLIVPPREWGAALIYFTGNDIFNRSMRLLARRKGMRLNQHGLYGEVLRNRGQKIASGTLLEGQDERRIFELLGVPYRPPEHRAC